MSVSLLFPYNRESRDELFLEWNLDLWLKALAHLAKQSYDSEL